MCLKCHMVNFFIYDFIYITFVYISILFSINQYSFQYDIYSCDNFFIDVKNKQYTIK